MKFVKVFEQLHKQLFNIRIFCYTQTIPRGDKSLRLKISYKMRRNQKKKRLCFFFFFF